MMSRQVNAMATDALVGAARRWIVGLMADAGVPTYSYYFRQVSIPPRPLSYDPTLDRREEVLSVAHVSLLAQ